MQRSRSATILPLLIAGLLAGACVASTGASPTPTSPPSSPTASPTASASPSPTAVPSPSGASTGADDAVARVLDSDPRFTGIRRLDPNLIGQASWYTVEPTGSDFKVTVRIGWGDCQAGCIDEHIWVFQVAGDGTLALQSESGEPLPPGVAGSGGPGAGASMLDIALVAGPVCPVERNPPDPNCAARPVAGARVVVRDASGAEKASGVSDQTGHVRLALPGGAYTVEAMAVQGIMGNPSLTEVQVAATGTTAITLAYDTGIR
jgi:hypothetical protein